MNTPALTVSPPRSPQGDGTPERPHVFLVRLSGELSIKAKGTRHRFTNRLVHNLEDALRSAGLDFELRRTWSRLFVTASSAEAGEVIGRVFGVASASRIEPRAWESLDDVLRHGEELFAPRVAGKTFAVRARRIDRRLIPFRRAEVECELGARLLPHAAGVDLTAPQVTVHAEIHPGQVYFFTDRLEGCAGLPLGVGGRAVALVSGGFDSIVAAWMLLRRGLVLDYVFCNLGGATHRDGTLAVMKVLSDQWSYGSFPRFHMVDFQPLVEELEACCPAQLWQVVLKRQMFRVAGRVARETGASAIVTGESVGQVSSQTLQNLSVISEATRRLILRPLAGANKDEIFAWARQIGSFDLSAKVPEYCALVRKQPATHASRKRVEDGETGLDPELVRSQVGERVVLDLRALDLEMIAAVSCEVETVPQGATVVDLRSQAAFSSWHYPGASRLSYFEALKAWTSMDREKTYLFYCEVGLKSAHLAELMRAGGYTAYHFKDGLKNVLKYYESVHKDEALRAVMSPVLLDRVHP